VRRLGCVALLALWGCLLGPPEGAEPAAVGDTFIAQQKNFDGLTRWHSFPLGEELLDDGTMAPRTVYLNHLPPSGATHFPVGTIVVKITEIGAARETWQIHAMVKRGRRFNTQRAAGWEWLELNPVLRADARDQWRIEWRGEEPPSRANYRCVPPDGKAVADCNVCHEAARKNDYVMTPELSLTHF
jgi:hypothetical protein